MNLKRMKNRNILITMMSFLLPRNLYGLIMFDIIYIIHCFLECQLSMTRYFYMHIQYTTLILYRVYLECRIVLILIVAQTQSKASFHIFYDGEMIM